MKTQLLILTSFLSLGAMAQITVDHTYIATLGDTVWLSEDTINGTTLDLGSAGGNQVWDFTGLIEHDPDGGILEDPSTAPLNSNYPEATFVLNDLEEDSLHLFFKQTNTALDIVGVIEYDSNGNPVELDIEGPWRFMQFPSTGGSSWESEILSESQTEFFGVDFDSIGPHPYIDSLRGTYTISFYNEIDAWGEMQLPNGTFQSIRQKVTQTIRNVGDCYYDGAWRPYTSLMLTFIDSVNYDTADDATYRWWSNNEAATFMIAEVDVDSNGTPDSNVVFLNKEEIWPVGIQGTEQIDLDVFPNPSSDQVTVTTNLDGGWNVEVYDVSAKRIATYRSTSNQIDFPVVEWPAGTYMLNITDNDGSTLRLKKIQVIR